MDKKRRFLQKLETDSEAGLTNAQLLLTNDDLKPGTKRPYFLVILIRSCALTGVGVL
jgi:hypothetical protein